MLEVYFMMHMDGIIDDRMTVGNNCGAADSTQVESQLCFRNLFWKPMALPHLLEYHLINLWKMG
jgi:hypothetical protein